MDREWWEAALVMAVVVIGMVLGSYAFFDGLVSYAQSSSNLKYFVPVAAWSDGQYIYIAGYNESSGYAALAKFEISSGLTVGYKEYIDYARWDMVYASPKSDYVYVATNGVVAAVSKSDLSLVNTVAPTGSYVAAMAIYGSELYIFSYPTGRVGDWVHADKCSLDLSSCTKDFASSRVGFGGGGTTEEANHEFDYAVELGYVGMFANATNDYPYVYMANLEQVASASGATDYITGYQLPAVNLHLISVVYAADLGKWLAAFTSDFVNVTVYALSYDGGTSVSKYAEATCTLSAPAVSFGVARYVGNNTLVFVYNDGSGVRRDYFRISLGTGTCSFDRSFTDDGMEFHRAAVYVNGLLYYFVYDPVNHEAVGLSQPVAIMYTTVYSTVTRTITSPVTVYTTVTPTTTVTRTATVTLTVGRTVTTTLTKTASETYTVLYTVTKPYTTTITTVVESPVTVTETVTEPVTETITETSPSTTTYTTEYTTTYTTTRVSTTTYVTTITSTYTTTEWYTTVITNPLWNATVVKPTTVTGTTTYTTTVTTVVPVAGIVVPVGATFIAGVSPTTVYEPVPVPVEVTKTTTVYVPKVESGGYMVYLFALLFVVLLIVGLRLARRR